MMALIMYVSPVLHGMQRTHPLFSGGILLPAAGVQALPNQGFRFGQTDFSFFRNAGDPRIHIFRFTP
ncbi:MAG: hypothetical protein ACLVJZ_05855 [[Clostridium] leptum]